MKSVVYCLVVIFIAVLRDVRTEDSESLSSTTIKYEDDCKLITCATGKTVCGCDSNRCKYFGSEACIEQYNKCEDESKWCEVILNFFLWFNYLDFGAADMTTCEEGLVPPAES